MGEGEKMGKKSKTWFIPLLALWSFGVFCVAYYLGQRTLGSPYTVTVTQNLPSERVGDTQQTQENETPNALLDGEKININTASQKDLERLPGIGASRAADIVTWRESNGGFQSIEELMEISGIGQATFEGLKDYVTVD